ncbi:hypothetical protein DACRYDRAFT_113928 [Dacryopinax primogenitus]|uniref:Uncharacterized protein n=1 Tax=Dacryopinax primogenitus (strain DJM 731) TaxID=1858805 RepID=M5GAM7_DACPD|nr:uncharacterized protein DACRYDRAFT_113928 [Dacryopinax primogenitus]EJU05919.1 hypothetical protein DACRYDRAFT_113928 [Dacryopinax primogenitus]
MAVVFSVPYRTIIPPLQPQHPPTSPDSFRATPSSSPIRDERGLALHLPYLLAPVSRPTSPASESRIDTLVCQIRDKEILDLYLVSTKLRGPFGPGASKWGVGSGRQETYDEEDLVLPECEEHAAELERQKTDRRMNKITPNHYPSPLPLRLTDQEPDLTFSSRSTISPLLSLGTPKATSTPVALSKSSSSQLSATQTRLSFPHSKPAATRTQSKDSLKPSTPINMSPPKRTISRFAFSKLDAKHGVPPDRAHSSQPTPFNSQFNVDQAAQDLSNLLEEDAFEVERGCQRVVVVSSDEH